jgi:hypothetical protein
VQQYTRRLATALKLLTDILSMRDEQDQDTVFGPGVDNPVIAYSQPGKACEFALQLLAGVRYECE